MKKMYKYERVIEGQNVIKVWNYVTREEKLLLPVSYISKSIRTDDIITYLSLIPFLPPDYVNRNKTFIQILRRIQKQITIQKIYITERRQHA